MNHSTETGRKRMNQDEIDALAQTSVRTLIEEGADIIPHYLVLQTLGSAIASIGKESPIVGIDPITMTLMRELSRINPGISSRDLTELRITVGLLLRDGNYAERFFERKDI